MLKVLQICLKPPLPEIDGGCKAINNLTKGLLDNKIDVKVLTISTHKHPFIKGAYPEGYIANTAIENFDIDTRVKPFNAFLNLFSSKSYNIERFYSKSFEALIINTLKSKNYDVVLLESLYVSMYISCIKRNSTAKIIYRSHNIESEIWLRNAQQQNGFKKSYLNLLARRLKRYEQQIINQFDGIAAITNKDKFNLQQLGCKLPIEVIPFGIDISDYPTKDNLAQVSIFHIGSMDWEPNLDGIKWFLEHVWDDVVQQNPTVQLNIAGKGMPGWLLKHQQKNVTIVGEVENAQEFISNNTIMIVPLFSGSGMRIKIIEAMALQKLVIATSVAAEGIDYVNLKNLVIANTKDEFILEVNNYLSNKAERIRIANNGKVLVETKYGNKQIVSDLISFITKL